jgi:CrcB protein
MERFLLISFGAVLGANARYWIGDWAAQRWGATFPFGTLLINLTGSFLLGLFMTLATERFMLDPRWRIFLAVGFLGAYTTFSTYTFESMTLITQGQWGLGLLDLFGSAILGGLAVILGIYAGKLI